MIWITAEIATHPIPWILRETVLRIPAAIPARTRRRIQAAIPVRIRLRTAAGTTWITAAEINYSQNFNRTRTSGRVTNAPAGFLLYGKNA